MIKQPAINVPKSLFAIFLDWVTLLLFLAVIIYLVVQYPSLPDQVPGHYDSSGMVDRWGSKIEMWILPLVGAGLWVLMTIVEKYPHTFNYINLRQDNLEAQYRNAKLMINVLKNESVLLFSFLIFQDIRVANGAAEGLGYFFMPVFLFVIFGSMIIFLIRMLRM
ncbi:DUF1648 domain-containing protein [Metaplanococcus flavidus]|uniref:DUF1648 domain-containing protein n=1 Tax=Metaplanococcus flavidus TaxID=569883 RepID=A0ABW3L8Z7_9BACL